MANKKLVLPMEIRSIYYKIEGQPLIFFKKKKKKKTKQNKKPPQKVMNWKVLVISDRP